MVGNNNPDKRGPAFQFYPDRFLGGVSDFNQAEVGAYQLLLLHQWNRGWVPVEPERQQTIARGPVSDAVLAKFKKCNDGHLRNDFMEEVRANQLEFRAKQSAAGKASAAARAAKAQPEHNSGATAAQPNAKPKGNSLSPSLLQQSLQQRRERKRLSKPQRELCQRFEQALGSEWVNDAGKWVNRVKVHSSKCERVIAEIEAAIKEKRIRSTVARYAENTWREFQ